MHKNLKEQLVAMQKLTHTSKLLNFKGIVSWKDMTDLYVRLGERVEIDKAINHLEYKSPDLWVWDTVIPHGIRFQKHKHDFVEVCVVHAGVLTEKLTADRFKKGMYVIYEFLQPHEPSNDDDAEEDCHITVYWVNTKKVSYALNIINTYNQKNNKDVL